MQHMSKSNVMSARAVDESLFILKNLQTAQRFGADQVRGSGRIDPLPTSHFLTRVL